MLEPLQQLVLSVGITQLLLQIPHLALQIPDAVQVGRLDPLLWNLQGFDLRQLQDMAVCGIVCLLFVGTLGFFTWRGGKVLIHDIIPTTHL